MARLLPESAGALPADVLEGLPDAVPEAEALAGPFRFALAVLVVAACFLVPFLLAGLTVAVDDFPVDDFLWVRVPVGLVFDEAPFVERPFLATLDFFCLDCFFTGFLFVMTA